LETLAVCLAYNVTCVRGGVHKANGSTMDKAGAQNHAMRHLRRDSWLCVLDADIVLPCDFRHRVHSAALVPDCVYGVDRVDCPDFAAWQAYLTAPVQSALAGCLTSQPCGWPLAYRVSHPEYGGWCPLGFFQLWHSSVRDGYTLSPGANADHSDLLHSSQWPRQKRVLLPDWYAIHLLSGPRAMGADWAGRTTGRWGANPWKAATGAVRSGKRGIDAVRSMPSGQADGIVTPAE
jgi:hypothetical protein